MKVVGDRILIEPIIEKEVGGFVVGQGKTSPPQKGTVIAVGPGKKDERMVLCEGDVILYAKHAGTEVKVGDKNLIIMREADAFFAL